MRRKRRPAGNKADGPRTLVLRRAPNEPFVLDPSRSPARQPQRARGMPCEVSAHKARKPVCGKSLVYTLILPAGWHIAPAEWRAHVPNRRQVARLVGNNITDNLGLLQFEPWSAALADRAETLIREALTDLCAIFTVQAVRCSFEADELRANVEGRFLDGTRGIVVGSATPD